MKGIKGLQAKVDGEAVVLTLPIKNLVWACEHNPDFPLKVKDKEALAKHIADRLVDYDEDESGASALMRLLDELFVDAYEEGLPLEEKPIG